ncbi:MAG TPA: hypothetical protein DD490_25760 [Acidobacteria bacterium]|nr:hypothetical protein [Acidobacteriota bacterium]
MGEDVLEGFPLSAQQRAVWTLQQTGGGAFRCQCAVWLDGPVAPGLLEEALAEVVARHEILRTRFEHAEELAEPFQVIGEPAGPPLSRVEGAAGEDVRSLLAARRRAERLLRDPPPAASLAQPMPGRHLLILDLPALCADAVTLGNLVREIAGSYAARAEGRTADAGETLQYVDFAEWQRALLSSGDAEIGREHWDRHDLRRLGEARLPLAAAPEARGELRPEILDVPCAPRVLSSLEAMDASIRAVLAAAWAALAGKLLGGAVLLGVAAAGRNFQELSDALGLYETFLPVRLELDAEEPFAALAGRVEKELATAARWQPFFGWGELAGPAAFFPVCFAFEDRSAVHRAGPLELTVADQYTCTHRFEVKLVGVRRRDGLALELHYDPDLFRREDVERLRDSLQAELASLAADPRRPLGDVDLLGADEREHLARHAVPLPFPSGDEAPVHLLFERWVAERSAEPALVFEDRVLSWAELNSRANQLAHRLRREGVGPDVPVAICLPRSPPVVVCLLGILKAGGAYVPLDPSLPSERLATLLEDCAARVLLADRRTAVRLPQGPARRILVDVEADRIASESRDNPRPAACGANLAYVIFTSGSTGRPKGVGVEHRQLLSYLQGILQVLDTAPGDAFALVSTFAADLGHTCLFPALCGGGVLHLLADERVADGDALADYGTRHRIDFLKIVPGHLAALLEAERRESILPRRGLILGGETAARTLLDRVRRLAPQCRTFNHYGPTETTVGAMIYEMGPDLAAWPGRGMPLARPLAGSAVAVLDPRLTLVPAWAAGELYIGGSGVARGYVGRPDLTAERFLPDPFAGAPGARRYRTGDLVRRLGAAGLEVLGRVDHQVKIHGFRIEPGEIEAALRRHPAIRDAVVVAREDGGGEKRLIAYVTAEGAGVPARSELRIFLAAHLPEPMIPAVFVPLESLPRTANGKLDRRALPPPPAAMEPTGGDGAPRSLAEEVLAEIWAELLRLDRIGIHDNFFELGGHSLLLTQMASRVRKVFGVELSLRTLFDHPTVAKLALQVAQGADGGEVLQLPAIEPAEPAARLGDQPLSSAQQRIWFVDRLVAGSFFNIPAAVRIRGRLDEVALEKSLSEIVRRHEVLRATFRVVGRQPVQRIAPPAPLPLPRIDLCALAVAVRDACAVTLAREEGSRPFDLSCDRPLRAALLRTGENERVLLLTLHHMVSDAWSIDLLVRELAALYEALAAGAPSPLPEPALQYTDYARWQQRRLRGDAEEKLLAFWRRQLAGAPLVLELPMDHPRPTAGVPQAARHPLALSQELAQALRALSRGEGATLFMTLLAAFNVLLGHLAGRDDILVGANAANRTPLETEGLIGCFINQIVLRTDLAGNPTFRELLARVRRTALDAYAHELLPFDRLVEELAPPREPGRHLLFQVKLELQSRQGPRELAGLVLEQLDTGYQILRYDLYLALRESPEGITGALAYNADLFEPGTVACMADQLAALLQSIAGHPEATLDELRAVLAETGRRRRHRETAELEQAALRHLGRTRRRAAETIHATSTKGVEDVRAGSW